MSNNPRRMVFGLIWSILHVFVFGICMYHAMTWYINYPLADYSFSKATSMMILIGTEGLILLEYFAIKWLNARGLLTNGAIAFMVACDILWLVLNLGLWVLLSVFLLGTRTGPGTDFFTRFGFISVWVLLFQLIFPRINLLCRLRTSPQANTWVRIQVVLSFVPILNLINLPLCFLYYRKQPEYWDIIKRLLKSILFSVLLCITVTIAALSLAWVLDWLSSGDAYVWLTILGFTMIPYGIPLFVDLGLINAQCDKGMVMRDKGTVLLSPNPKH